LIRVLIVDDEAPARSRFSRMLTQFEDVILVGEGSDGLMALDQAAKLKPDVIFLDIEMPELDGLGVAEALPYDGPKIVFVTAYNEHALKAFEVCAFDYIVKPVAPERLQVCIEKIRVFFNKKNREQDDQISEQRARLRVELAGGDHFGRRFAVRVGNRFVICNPEKVSAIISREHYSAIVIDDKELLSDDSLDLLSARLDPKQFLRVHRSAVINVDFLKELEREGDRKYMAVLHDTGQTRVPISRERLNDIKVRLGIN